MLVFYVIIVGTTAIEVLRREVLAYSSAWGEEVVRYSFIYLACIGGAAAIKERAHIRIDVLFHNASPRAKALLYIFGDLGGQVWRARLDGDNAARGRRESLRRYPSGRDPSPKIVLRP